MTTKVTSDLLTHIQSGTGAAVRTLKDKLGESVSVKDFGAVGDGTDESSAAAAMIAAHNRLYVPAGFTLTCKNIALNTNTSVVVEGTLRLPSGCVDFDRLIHADSKTGISIKIKEIDGNYAGQSGSIGTHLVYLTNCPDAKVDVDYAHDHYIASGAAMTSVDGYRNTSTGAIWLYKCNRTQLNVGLLSGWGREGVYAQQCEKAEVHVGHCQGHATRNTEYSGVQVSGVGNRLLRASVDFAGASGVGFDTVAGVISNILSTNTRENHGVNFGHPGFPASGSVASNIVVDGAFVDGIKVSSSTVDLSIDNFSVRNAGRYGISVSDSSLRGKFSSGVFQNSGQANVQVSGTEIQTSNVRSAEFDTRSLSVDISAGSFVDGETITTTGKSAVVRKVIRNLANTKQILLVNSVSGTFAATDAITGGTSGATGTVTAVNTPVQRLEQSSGVVAEDIRLFSGTQDQIRFPDGTAILIGSVAVAVATGGALETLSTNFSSNVKWASAPRIVAQVNSVNSTSGYTVDQIRVSASTTAFTIHLLASAAQTYGFTVIAIGRWK